MDKEIFDKFYDKFNVAVRKGRGGNYSYVTANDVTDRMNTLFQGNWCTEVMDQEIDATGIIIVRLRVSVLDSETKGWFWHEGYGGHKDAGGEPGSSFKSAYSKALVNACRRWGVGLYLDDDDEGVIPTAGQSTSAPTVPTVPTALPTQGLPPAPVQKPAGPPVASSPPMMSKPPVVEEMKIQQVPPTTIPVQSPPQPVSMPKIPEPNHGAPLASAPMMGKPAVTPLPAVEPTPMEIPSVDNISDVQKIAIQSMYDMRGYKYEDLALAVLGSVPDVSTLSHDQAVSIIQHGNDLYKKNKTG
jgi:hypothetical protein